MGNRLSLAKSYLKKVQHLYDHAGPAGYDQALFSQSKISEYRSNSGPRGSDAFELGEISKKADAMMDEMKKRRDEFMAAQEGNTAEKEPDCGTDEKEI